MRGAGSVLVKPKQQLAVVLPAVVPVLLCVAVSYVLLCVVGYSAVHSLERQAVDQRIIEEFLKDNKIFLVIFWAVSGTVALGGLVWSWWISLKIFGPMARLERHLSAVLSGEQKIANVKVRESDMLFALFERINQVLSRPQG